MAGIQIICDRSVREFSNDLIMDEVILEQKFGYWFMMNKYGEVLGRSAAGYASLNALAVEFYELKEIGV